MGVDSGLPDFRGPEGFWKAYPALGRARVAFTSIANPAAFRREPRLAWGFYGHRLNLYRETPPHAGFAILRRWAGQLAQGAFVFTSNVDGHFQRAGFDPDRIVECHGSIHHLQCAAPCADEIWPADGFVPEVDIPECRLTSALPACPHCGGLARPNILMFGDGEWLEQRLDPQQRNLRRWLERVSNPVVIELGAGMAVPTVRMFSEQLGLPLIRINPDDGPDGHPRRMVLRSGALAALAAIDEALSATMSASPG